MGDVVSAEHRRSHNRAIRSREQWRVQYAVIGQAIRSAKNRISKANRSNSIDRESEMQLVALRLLANDMMVMRFIIKQRLRRTAYEYATADELAVAAMEAAA